MQNPAGPLQDLFAEAYNVLKSVGKLSNEELHQVFSEWNRGELLSFLIEIAADIFGVNGDKREGYLVDKVLDKTSLKGTGKWTIQQAAELVAFWLTCMLIRKS